jgi:hypothetical protein
MYSLWILTATLATGAAPEPPAAGYTAPPAQQVAADPAPSIGDRLRTLLQRTPQTAAPGCACQASARVQSVTPYGANVVPSASPYAAVVVPPASPYAPAQPAREVAAVQQQQPAVVPVKAEDQVGHEIDYSWITGQLTYIRTAGGRWVVRYAPLGQVDRYGGSVVLAPTVEMKNYREGDMVRVHGEILNEGRAVPGLGGALYRVNMIFMIDRASPER